MIQFMSKFSANIGISGHQTTNKTTLFLAHSFIEFLLQIIDKKTCIEFPN